MIERTVNGLTKAQLEAQLADAVRRDDRYAQDAIRADLRELRSAPSDTTSDDDTITRGGIPPSTLASRRAKRESERHEIGPTERPTQSPLVATPRTAQEPTTKAPPTRERALDLATRFAFGGAVAQSEVGRDGAEVMASWIVAQPDYHAAIVEWRDATRACEAAEQARARAVGSHVAPILDHPAHARRRRRSGSRGRDRRFATAADLATPSRS